jgi:hypothetical protein
MTNSNVIRQSFLQLSEIAQLFRNNKSFIDEIYRKLFLEVCKLCELKHMIIAGNNVEVLNKFFMMKLYINKRETIN